MEAIDAVWTVPGPAAAHVTGGPGASNTFGGRGAAGKSGEPNTARVSGEMQAADGLGDPRENSGCDEEAVCCVVDEAAAGNTQLTLRHCVTQSTTDVRKEAVQQAAPPQPYDAHAAAAAIRTEQTATHQPARAGCTEDRATTAVESDAGSSHAELNDAGAAGIEGSCHVDQSDRATTSHQRAADAASASNTLANQLEATTFAAADEQRKLSEGGAGDNANTTACYSLPQCYAPRSGTNCGVNQQESRGRWGGGDVPGSASAGVPGSRCPQENPRGRRNSGTYRRGSGNGGSDSCTGDRGRGGVPKDGVPKDGVPQDGLQGDGGAETVVGMLHALSRAGRFWLAKQLLGGDGAGTVASLFTKLHRVEPSSRGGCASGALVAALENRYQL